MSLAIVSVNVVHLYIEALHQAVYLVPQVRFSRSLSHRYFSLVLGQRSLIRNKTQTAVTNIRLNKRRTKTGIFFTDLTFCMSQHTSSEEIVSFKF